MTRKTGRPRGRPTNLQKKLIYKVGAGARSEMEAQGGAAFLSPEQIEALGYSADPPAEPGSPPLDEAAITRASRFLKSPFRAWIRLIAKLLDGGRRTPADVEGLVRARRERGDRLPPDPRPGWMAESDGSAAGEDEWRAARPMFEIRDLIRVVENERQKDPSLSPAEMPERIARRLFGLPVHASPEWTIKDLFHRAKSQSEAREEKYTAARVASWEAVLQDLAARAGIDMDDLLQASRRQKGKSGE